MFYTGRGDAGFTKVIGSPALPKCDLRLEALGALDEAQSYLGLVRSLLSHTSFAEPILRVQQNLRLLMTECATASRGDPLITNEHTARLEEDMALWEGISAGFKGLTVPGETLAGAHIHIARTIIRRSERQVVALLQAGVYVNPEVLTYLNRLSSWAYMLAAAAEASGNANCTFAA
jgi:cob(I)alamin adenosyltransferase